MRKQRTHHPTRSKHILIRQTEAQRVANLFSFLGVVVVVGSVDAAYKAQLLVENAKAFPRDFVNGQ
jgi:hypothetical protein